MTPFGAFLFVGCKAEDGELRYNDAGDVVFIDVGVTTDTSARSTDLHSGVGRAVIGLASVDPGAGPVGTLHRVVVEVFDEYQDDVTRVSVALDAGERGVTDVDLDHDLADVGLWAIEVETLGAPSESRTDAARFRLWTSASGGVADTSSP